MASSVSASSASWPTAGAKHHCRFANNCCECRYPVVRMLHCLKSALHRCGSVHVVAARCFLSSASPLRNLIRNRWNGGFALTALNSSSVAARSSKASASPRYVCSATSFRSHSVTWDHGYRTCAIHPVLKTISVRIGFAHFNDPLILFHAINIVFKSHSS